MSGDPAALIWTGFHGSASAHGGDLRADQISTLCAEAGCEPELIRMSDPIPPWRRWYRGVRGVSALHQLGLPVPWRSVSLTGYTIGALERLLAARPRTRLMIWESTETPLPALIARRFGRAVLALPHNVEAFDGTIDCLQQVRGEGIALRWATQVTCIAEEDRWFWANLGIAADFLPYYPTAARQRWLGEIASRRRQAPPLASAPWLILGTAHHLPTLQGMRTILTWLAEVGDRAGLVCVAGGGTEKLRDQFEGPRLRCLGSINQIDLTDILATTRGLIVHQESGSGALTRIPEALCAGVPVIASVIAARSTRGYSGIQVYENIEEFRACLAQNPPRELPHLAAPTDAIRRFQAVVRRLARSDSRC